MTDTESSVYAETLDALTCRVREARFTLQRRANAELIALYWHIGETILESETATADVASRLVEDLRDAFPSMRDLSTSDARFMRTFAAVWPKGDGIFHQPVGQLPWSFVVELLDRLDDQSVREWYAGKIVEHTWSRADLVAHITDGLHERDGSAPCNFAAALRRTDSDLAHELVDEPSTRGLLGVDQPLAEECPRPHAMEAA